MTEPRPEHRLDPEQDEYVRRLLADARHTEPPPADVADRLDDALAGLVPGLVAGRPGSADEGPDERRPVVPVRDLAVERRRHRVVQLLVAAAAVVAVGVGLGQLDLGSVTTADSDAGGSAADGAAGAEGMQDAPAASEAPSAAGPDRAAPDALSARPVVITDRSLRTLAEGSPLTLDQLASYVTTEQFAPHDAAVPGEVDPKTTDDDGVRAPADGPTTRGDGATKAGGAWFTCRRGPYGAGRLVAVEYRGNPAVVAVRPSTGDSVVVELLRCGTATVLRSVTVPTS